MKVGNKSALLSQKQMSMREILMRLKASTESSKSINSRWVKSIIWNLQQFAV